MSSSYSELEGSLKGLPPTWYPALIRTAVEQSLAKSVWVAGGVINFVRNIPGAGPDVGVEAMKALLLECRDVIKSHQGSPAGGIVERINSIIDDYER